MRDQTTRKSRPHGSQGGSQHSKLTPLPLALHFNPRRGGNLIRNSFQTPEWACYWLHWLVAYVLTVVPQDDKPLSDLPLQVSTGRRCISHLPEPPSLYPKNKTKIPQHQKTCPAQCRMDIRTSKWSTTNLDLNILHPPKDTMVGHSTTRPKATTRPAPYR